MKKINWVLASVLLVNFLLILFTSQVTLQNFPNSSDEYSQYISAKLFSESKLSVPSPPQKDFFEFYNIVNDGKYYGKYPPGWPFIWSIGILLNISWLINPLFGILTLVVIYFIAKENFSDSIANTAIILTLFNPFIIFNSASYFSHPSALFFLSLFAYFYFKSFNNPAAKLNYVMLGITCGIGFLIRPYAAIAIILPFAVHRAYHSVKTRKIKTDVKLFSIALIVFLLFFALFLLYNYFQTGNPFLQTFNKYRSCDKLGITSCSFDFTFGIRNNFIFRLLKLNQWVPLSVFLLIFYLFLKKEWKGMLLFGTFASLFLAHFFYLFFQGNEYGPRYLYEAVFAIFIIMAVSIATFKKRTKYFIITFILLLNFLSFYIQTGFYTHQVGNRLTLYGLAEEKNISNAVVFIRNGIEYTMRAPELTRNGIYFNETVLYALDKKENNKELMKAFPNRTFYYFTYNQTTKTGQILPYS